MTSALLVVSGCVKEMPADGSDQSTDSTPTEIAMKSVTLDASSVNLNLGKSTVDDSGDFSWSSDDAIAVNVSYVDGNGQPASAFFRLDVKEISAENNNVATFEGKIPENGTFEGVAVYPYNEGHVYSDGKLTVNFPNQISETNHLPVMYAKIQAGEALQFQHLSSVLKLTYRYVPKGTDGLTLTSEAVAGLYDVNLETGALTATENVTNQVKATFAALEQISAEKSVYIPVPAGFRTVAADLNKGEELVKWSSISQKSAYDFKTGRITLLPSVNVHFSELYIVGASEDLYSWSTTKMRPMEEVSDHVFTWTGDIFKGNRFRFPAGKIFYPAIYKINGKPTMTFEGMGNDYDFTVEEDGNYTVTVDATDMDDIKVDITFNRIAYPDKYLFINGKSTENHGYYKAAEDWMWMTQVEPGVFEWTGHLADDVGKDFKFRAKDGEWVPYYHRDKNAEDYWTLIYQDGSTSEDNKFEITQGGDGLYKVTANLNTMKVTCELLESCPRLYITGYSVSTDGFSNKPGANYVMHYTGNGIYTWSGKMYVTGVKNGFKILEYNGWNPHWGPTTGSNVGMDGTATYHTEGDFKWILKESDGYSDGEYTVVLDTVNGTLTVASM